MNFQWYPGHMTKAKRQMQEDIKLIDLVIELVDARIPLSSRNPDIDELGKNKYRLILMNKADLADRKATEQWSAFFKKKGYYVVSLDARSKNGMKSITDIIMEACKEKMERDRKRGIKNRPVRAMVVGIPNVGKSTLFNCLSGCERSIVTEIAGTTRDVIEESVKIGDLTLRLSDTAGIRDTDDVIEGIGVNIAYKRLDEAQLIIAVFDGSCPLTEDDINLLKNLKDKKAIAVINKNDVEQKIDSDIIKSNNIQIVYISAKENKGIQEVQQAIESLFEANELDFESGTAANERQKRCIDLCLQQIDEAISALESGVLLDAITVLLDESVHMD